MELVILSFSHHPIICLIINNYFQTLQWLWLPAQVEVARSWKHSSFPLLQPGLSKLCSALPAQWLSSGYTPCFSIPCLVFDFFTLISVKQFYGKILRKYVWELFLRPRSLGVIRIIISPHWVQHFILNLKQLLPWLEAFCVLLRSLMTLIFPGFCIWANYV